MKISNYLLNRAQRDLLKNNFFPVHCHPFTLNLTLNGLFSCCLVNLITNSAINTSP